jgi:hypothetical protein
MPWTFRVRHTRHMSPQSSHVLPESTPIVSRNLRSVPRDNAYYAVTHTYIGGCNLPQTQRLNKVFGMDTDRLPIKRSRDKSAVLSIFFIPRISVAVRNSYLFPRLRTSFLINLTPTRMVQPFFSFSLAPNVKRLTKQSFIASCLQPPTPSEE